MPRPFHITTVLLDLEGPFASAACDRRVSRTLGKGLIGMLRARGLGVGTVSRYTQKAALGFLEHRFQIRPADIRPCICLDAPGAGRRRRNPFQAAARSMRTPAQRFMVVSANRDVLRLAKDAGTVAVEWCANGTLDSSEPVADYRVADLPQLNRLIRMGVSLPAGKLPNDLLQEFLDEIVFDDPALLIQPGCGRGRRRRGRGRGGGSGPEVGPHHLRHRCDRTLRGAGQCQRHRHGRCDAPLAVDDPSVPGRQHAVFDFEHHR